MRHGPNNCGGVIGASYPQILITKEYYSSNRHASKRDSKLTQTSTLRLNQKSTTGQTANHTLCLDEDKLEMIILPFAHVSINWAWQHHSFRARV